MKKKILIFFAVLLSLVNPVRAETPSVKSKKSMHTNHLVDEKSPYLLQHRHNPVDWYPWGEAAFGRAREEKKPIFLSIGYSTCYWCHVMEKESFENEDVARALNSSFICIKLDREERPDVDSIYMNAVVSLTGRGGWPMSVFLTPELKPFYGGTYFPRENFLQLLSRISEAWKTQREAVMASSNQLTEMIAQEAPSDSSSVLDEKSIALAVEQIGSRFDTVNGGFGPAPKFPPSFTLMLLLRAFARTQEAHLLEMITFTLEKMARGGIYDHVGGGFHRYATDTKWLVPHFEKMLYDNAQLATIYLEAYQATGNEMFSAVADETLTYVLRDMTHPDGGFYSAEDAGDVAKEGEFYVWTEKELAALLTPAELGEISKLYGVSAAGNFEEHQNIFNLQMPHAWKEKHETLAATALKKVFDARAKRSRPHRDDKILSSWNGLMIASFAQGYEVLGKEAYLAAAQNAASFLQKNLWKNGKLLRRFRDGDASFAATIEDYSFLIYGLLKLYEADADPRWVNWAIALQKQADEELWDNKTGGYFRASPQDSALIVKQKEFTDGAEPSGNGLALSNLLRLFDLTFDAAFEKRAQELLRAFPSTFAKFPSAFTAALLGVDYESDRSKEVAIVGDKKSPEAAEFKRLLGKTFLPNKTLAWGDEAPLESKEALGIFRGKKIINGKTTFYVCEKGNCKLPTNDPVKAIELIKEKKAYAL